MEYIIDPKCTGENMCVCIVCIYFVFVRLLKTSQPMQDEYWRELKLCYMLFEKEYNLKDQFLFKKKKKNSSCNWVAPAVFAIKKPHFHQCKQVCRFCVDTVFT